MAFLFMGAKGALGAWVTPTLESRWVLGTGGKTCDIRILKNSYFSKVKFNEYPGVLFICFLNLAT